MTSSGNPAWAPSNKLRSIQYIRAVAAIGVIVAHTGRAHTDVGYSGVDLFFVVSGFVMMLIAGHERSPGRFCMERLARIVPLYWTVTIVVATLFRSSMPKLVSSLFFWPDGGFPLVIQGWSLDLEMFYYILFAITLFAPTRWRLQVLAMNVWIVCVVLPLLMPASAPLTAWSSPLAFEFLAGAALHALWRHGYVPVGRTAWLVGAAGLTTLAATQLLGGIPAGWTRVAIWGGPAFAIVAAGLGVEASGQLPRVTLLEVLGNASYAIYLTHFIVIGLVSDSVQALRAPLAVSLAIVSACAIGWAVHFSFERPAHLLMTALLKPRRPRPHPTPA